MKHIILTICDCTVQWYQEALSCYTTLTIISLSDFSPFTWTETWSPRNPTSPSPSLPTYPASPGINQCNSTKPFYFPFSPQESFCFFITKRTWCILFPLTSSKRASSIFDWVSDEARRNQESGGSQSPPTGSRGHGRRADIREAEARWPGFNPRSSA